MGVPFLAKYRAKTDETERHEQHKNCKIKTHMKYNKWTLALASAGVVSLNSIANADEHMANNLLNHVSKTTISGYVDTSAIWAIGEGGNANFPGRTNDGEGYVDGFNLNVVQLSLASPLDESDWAAGYQVDLWLGPDSKWLASNTFGGDNADLGIKQAYVHLRAPVGNGLELKMGQFDTIIGYEVGSSPANPNFSRSYGFFIEPFQHTGLLATYPLTEELSFSAGIANSYGFGINDRVNNATGLPDSTVQWVEGLVGRINSHPAIAASGSELYLPDNWDSWGRSGWMRYLNNDENDNFDFAPEDLRESLKSGRALLGNAVSQSTIDGWKDYLGGSSQGSESQKTYMASLAYELPESAGSMAGTAFYLGFVDGLATDDAAFDKTSYFVGATIPTPMDGLSLGAAFDYAQDTTLPQLGFQPDQLGTLVGDLLAKDKITPGQAFDAAVNYLAPRDVWALAGYLSYQMDAKSVFNARVDYVTVESTALPEDAQFLSLTGTLARNMWDNVLTRLEVRWDHSLKSDFDSLVGDNNGDAVTVALNAVYQF